MHLFVWNIRICFLSSWIYTHLLSDKKKMYTHLLQTTYVIQKICCSYQEAIEDITKRMGAGMAKFICKEVCNECLCFFLFYAMKCLFLPKKEEVYNECIMQEKKENWLRIFLYFFLFALTGRLYQEYSC